MVTPVIGSGEYERPWESPRSATEVRLGDEPLVSVVMTSYNCSQWLEPALRSLFDQSWKRLEIILVDDRSTDRSLDIALALARDQPRLRVFQMERNVGTYRAKNAGMLAANGDVVCFADSDDRNDPRRIEKQLEALRATGIVATTCNYVRLDENGGIVLNRGLKERQALISLMIKRQVVDDVGWFDSVRTSADDEYFERIRHVYGRTAHANVPEPLYIALHRGSSLSTSGPARTDMTQEGTDFLSAPRRHYVESYKAWYAALAAEARRPYMPHAPQTLRPFVVDPTIEHGTFRVTSENNGN